MPTWKEKGLSKGELKAPPAPLAELTRFIDPPGKDADTVALVQYLGADQKFDKVLENQQILREPISCATDVKPRSAISPDVWKRWNSPKPKWREKPYFKERAALEALS